MANHRVTSVAVVAGWLLAGCAGESPAAERKTSDVTQAYAALVEEVAECGQEVGQCASSARGDVALLADCAEQLEACAAAGADAVQDIATSAADCGTQMRDCVEGGGGGESCQVELRQCLGVPAGVDDASDADGGAAGGPPDCVVTLLDCIHGGQEPPQCASGVRDCVLGALPTPDSIVPPVAPGGADAGPGAPADGPGAPADDNAMPIDLPPPAAAAIDCLQTLADCASNGGTPPDCIKESRDCVASNAP